MTKADGGEPPLTDLLDAINDLLYQLDKASGRVPQYVERAAARVGHAANAAAQADTADQNEPPPVIEGPITDANGDEFADGREDFRGQFPQEPVNES
jgi:hypothetical protein